MSYCFKLGYSGPGLISSIALILIIRNGYRSIFAIGNVKKLSAHEELHDRRGRDQTPDTNDEEVKRKEKLTAVESRV